MTTIQIRPEQAARLISLRNDAVAAEEMFITATQVAIAGLVGQGARVHKIERDGTITLTEPDKEDDDA